MDNRGDFCLKLYKDIDGKIAMEMTSIGFTADELVKLLAQQIEKIKVSQYLKSNRCIICGEIIPEGRQVCSICETV